MSVTVDDFGDELPPDDKAVGNTGHAEDHNKISRELGEVQAVVTDLVNNGVGIVGTVSDYDSLPLTGTSGYMYLVGPTKELYNWIGGEWVSLGSIQGPQGGVGAAATIGTLESATDLPPAGAAIGSLWWVPNEDVVLPPTGYATPTHVGSVSTAPASATTASVTLPGGRAAGDFAIVAIGYENGKTITVNAGWTLEGSTVYSGSFKVDYFTRVLDGSESSSFTSTLSVAGKQGIAMTVLRGVVGSIASFPSPEVADITSPVTSPSVTHTNDFVVVGGHVDRGGTPVTSITPPADFTAQTVAYGTGGGQIGIAQAYEITPETGGDTYTPGDWTFDTAPGGVVTWIVAIEVATV